MKLSLVPELGEDESLDSFVEHLCDIHLCRPRQLFEAAAEQVPAWSNPLGRSAMPSHLVRLSDLTGISIDRLQHATTHRYRDVGLHPISSRAHQSGSLAWSDPGHVGFCPECLRESDLRWDIRWYLRWTNICVRHHNLIVDACPICGMFPRSSRAPHPRRRGAPTTLWRIKQCPGSCSTELLAAANATPILPSGHAYAQEEWLQGVIRDGGAVCPYADDEYRSAQTILQDLTFLTRHALREVQRNERGVVYIPGAQPAEIANDDFVPTPNSPELELDTASLRKIPRGTFLVAQTAAIDIIRTEWSIEHCTSWISPRRANNIRSSRPKMLSHPSSALGRVLDLHRGINRFNPATKVIDVGGRRRTQHAHRTLSLISTASIDAQNLPATIWPTVARHVPALPDRAQRIFPQFSVIALALIGRQTSLKDLTATFGYQLTEEHARFALSQLIDHENGLAIVAYLRDLHTHLHRYPPPIDYRRRRRLWPRPASIGRNHLRALARTAQAPLTDSLKWRIERYVWQLITGNDPYITHGVELLHGPAAYHYRRFLSAMTNEFRNLAGEVAQRLLLEERIGEPVTYTPEFIESAGSWTTGTCDTFIDVSHRTDLRNSSLSLALAASTAGSSEELVHIALSGDRLTAHRLVRFAATAHFDRTHDAAEHLGVIRRQVNKETDYLQNALGEEIFIRAYFNAPTRELSAAGHQLRAVVQSNIDKLRLIASTLD